MDDGSLICIIPIVLVIACIALSIALSQASKKRMAQIHDAYQSQMSNIRGFSPTQSYISVNGETALGVDENRNLIALLAYNRDESVTYRVFTATDLIGAELFQKGKSSSQVRNNAITGALVGSIFGGAGAIVGSSIAGSKAAGDVDNISLVLTVNDAQIPNHVIYFRTPSYKNMQAEDQAKKWLSILEIMIHRAESGQIAPFVQVEAMPSKRILKESQDSAMLPGGQTHSAASVYCELRSTSTPHAYPIVIDRPTFTIGRSQTNDLILQDSTVSRQHALLSFQSNGWVLQDQNSATGSFINGRRITQQYLKNGDQVRIGSTVFFFSMK